MNHKPSTPAVSAAELGSTESSVCIPFNPELEALDDDLKKFYTDNFMTKYVPSVPIQIQIVRLLRMLIQQRDDRQNRPDNGKGTQDDVQPKQPI
jgi:hypothetical protein